MNAPATTNGTRPSDTVAAPAMPIATAPASATTASPTSARSDSRVPSGRPCSSSSACAHTPTAEEEREQRRREPIAVQLRRRGRAEGDVAQVPGRVRRVQQRERGRAIRPAAARRTPGAQVGSARPSALVPHITTPPPRLMRRTLHRRRSRPRTRAGRPARADGARRSRGCSAPGSARSRATRARRGGRAPAARRACTASTARATAGDGGTRELQRGDAPAGPHDARELAQRRRRIVDVAQQVGERQVVELAVGERQALRLAVDERHAPRERPRRARAAPGRRRASRRSGRARRRSTRSGARAPAATSPVPVATSSTRRPGGASTASTIARRQRGSCPKLKRGGDTVVVARQPGEQLERVALALTPPCGRGPVHGISYTRCRLRISRA